MVVMRVRREEGKEKAYLERGGVGGGGGSGSGRGSES